MVKFIKITAEQYAALETKNQDYFYYVGGSKLYLGTKELTTEADVKTAVALVNNGTKGNEALYTEISKLEGDASTEGSIAYLLAALKSTIEGEVVNSISAADESITVGGTATAVSLGVKISSKTGNNLSLETTTGQEGLYVNVPTQTDYTVAITETAGQSGDAYSKRYNVTQAASSLNVNIDIPKDMVVEEGTVVDITYDATEGKLYDGVTDVTEIIKGSETPTAADAGKYIRLIVANASSDRLYIAAKDLVDVYTAEQNAEKIQLAIDNNNVISADVVTGSIELTDLDSSVQTSLGLADSAVQSITTGDAATGVGSIKVDGTGVTVYGLGSAAAADTTDFDAAGAAAAVLGTSSDTSTAATVYGAKAYADSLASNYDAAGAAAAVLGTNADTASDNTVYGAKAYADSLLAWEVYSAE